MYKIMNNYNLRAVKLEDADALFEFSKDNEVTKYLSWESHKNIEETINVISNYYLTKTPVSFVIVNEDDTAIGVIDFNDTDRSDYKEIGYFLNPKYHNKGIMTNAVKKLLEIGFKELNYEVISISHVKENIQSQRVIEKSGFTYKQTFENIIYKNKNHSLLYYEMKGIDFNE